MFSISNTARTAFVGALALATVAAASAGGAFADSKRENQAPSNPFEQSVDEDAMNITFFNDYTSPLVTLFVTNVDDEYWGADLLEQEDIDPGQNILVDINDYSGQCEYDLRAEFANGEVLETWTVDFCQNNEFFYYSI